jgi:hypothetical protein
MNYRTPILLLLAVATTSAFCPGNPIGSNPRTTISKQQQPTALFLIDDILPIAVFTGAVAATIFQQKQQALANATKKKPTKASPDVVVPKPAPAAVVAPPAPAPVVPAAVAPKPVPAPAPVVVVPMPPKQDKVLSDLVQKVGSTIQDRRDTEQTVQENKIKALKAAAMAEAEAATKLKAESVVVSEPVSEASTSAPAKSGSKRAKVWRVVKKVVAPWRKWKNIN